MRIFCILGIIYSFNAFSCNLFFNQGESIRFDGEGKIERTMSKVKEKGWTYISQDEWKTYKKYVDDMNNNSKEYFSLSDAQMHKKISSKIKIKPETMKNLYIKGMVVEQSCQKVK